MDFIYKDEIPYYIECNPRMIEPANSAFFGVNFPEILIELSSRSFLPQELRIGKPNIKTHSTMALLLGISEKKKSRREVLKTFWKGIRHY